ncbi:hypothetical protein SCHPADRAFT_900922 [Schizopora paradoxa]|uniref:Uncharacterized protein n=1 Tax=Schizopora paradoxa TaxID=27342 RepID=A0A0H2S647_9AGAM|nr:hypothetical protein SCHPADRAFT_900922 [Schizopora paradoxa]
MPRILTPRELVDVAFFIKLKMDLWTVALQETDALRRNSGHAERTRRQLEAEGFVFDLSEHVQILEDDDDKGDEYHALVEKRSRTAKDRFKKAVVASALSQEITVDQIAGTGSYPDHLALFALKEIGRTLSELRAERGIPQPCSSDAPMARYLNNVDPLEPFAGEGFGLNTFPVSRAMCLEITDNPEGIENVVFTEDTLTYRIVNWGEENGERWWEVWCTNSDQFRLYDHSMKDLLRISEFVLF